MVEKNIKENKITEDNYFTLFSNISDIQDRTSLCSKPKYVERIKYCEKLIDKISINKNETSTKTILQQSLIEELEKVTVSMVDNYGDSHSVITIFDLTDILQKAREELKKSRGRIINDYTFKIDEENGIYVLWEDIEEVLGK